MVLMQDLRVLVSRTAVSTQTGANLAEWYQLPPEILKSGKGSTVCRLPRHTERIAKEIFMSVSSASLKSPSIAS
jgi:hypothetical protein